MIENLRNKFGEKCSLVNTNGELSKINIPDIYILLISVSILLHSCIKDEVIIYVAMATEATLTYPSTYGGSDGAIDLTVSGGTSPYSFLWSNDSTSEDLANLFAGEYRITVTDAEKKTKCDTFMLIQPDADDIIVDYSVVHPSETGASDGKILTEVSGGYPPYAYLWSTGSAEHDLYNLSAGNYSLSVSDTQQQLSTINILLTDSLSDIDGNNYAIVKIGEQIWMKQNLRVTHSPDGSQIESYPYNDNTSNSLVYGRLYSWGAAMNGSVEEQAQGICPCGWHIPGDEEFKTLEINLGMTRSEADMENIWRGVGIGTALKIGGNSGYDAPLGGRRSSSGIFSLLDIFEYVWTSSESGTNAWRRCLDVNSDKAGRWNTFPKTYGFSVRCIKDTE